MQQQVQELEEEREQKRAEVELRAVQDLQVEEHLREPEEQHQEVELEVEQLQVEEQVQGRSFSFALFSFWEAFFFLFGDVCVAVRTVLLGPLGTVGRRVLSLGDLERQKPPETKSMESPGLDNGGVKMHGPVSKNLIMHC